MKKNKTYIIAAISIILGLFFVYKGINKHFLSACKVYDSSSTLPIDYQNLMNALCHSGFTYIVGLIQVASGLLLIIPKTRLLGALLLLPVIINIFLFHLLIDNRPEELIETGIPLMLNLIVFVSFYPKWKPILN